MPFLLDADTLGALLITIIVFIGVKWYMRLAKYQLPPGPSLFSIVQAFYHFAYSSPKVVELATDWFEKYGAILSLSLGPVCVVALNSTEVAREAFTKIEFSNRPNVASLKLLSGGGNNIGQCPVGPRWLLHRKLALTGLRHFLQGSILEKRVHAVFKISSVYLDSWKGAFDPKPLFDLSIYNLLSECINKKTFRLEDDDFKKLTKRNDDLIMDFGNCMVEDILPIMSHIWPSRKYRQISDSIGYIQQVVGWEQLRKHKAKFNPDKIEDYMDVLLEAQKKAEVGGDSDEIDRINDMYIVMNVVDLFTAGTDTTRSTLNWIMKYIVVYPAVQDKLREEIDRVIGRDRLPVLSDRKKLPYLEAVMLEVMRIRPALPFALMHTASWDTKLSGYDVPKDSIIGLNIWSIQHDPANWPEPEAFKPERFINKEGQLEAKHDGWIAFGTGKRACPGEATAKNELVLLLACFMQNFRFRLNVGPKVDMSPDGCAFVHIPRPYKIMAERI